MTVAMAFVSMILHSARRPGYPELSLLDFDVRQLKTSVQARFPSLNAKPIRVWLRTQSTLACIQDHGQSATICLHSVLNHPQTPRSVVEFILCHEMLHLMFPPREVDGRRTVHPPEFWEAEKRFPHRTESWSWILIVLGACLKRDKRQQCTFVKSNWKRLMNAERLSLEWIMKLLESGGTTLAVKEEIFL
jgi:hypothetical protein